MLFCCAALFHIFFLTFGIGYLVIAFVTEKHNCNHKIISYANTMLIGFIILILLGQVLSFFIPLNLSLLVLLSLTAFWGIILFIRKSDANKRNILKTPYNFLSLSIFILFQLGILYYSSFKTEIWDTWMYHAQAIQWANKYAAIPGLANLSLHLGLNSSFFLFSAIISLREIVGYSVFIGNTFLFSLVLIKLFEIATQSEKRNKYLHLVLYYTIFIVILNYFKDWISSASPDVSSSLLIIYLIILVIEEESFFYSFILILTLSLTLITIKQSNACLLLFAVLFFQFSADKSISWLKFAGLVFIILGPWIIRNYILSGYPFYPLDFNFGLSPDWKVTPSEVDLLKKGILAWSRIPSDNYSNILNLNIQQWVPVWIKSIGRLNLLFLILTLLSPLIMISSYSCKENKKRNGNLLYFISFISVLLWFLSAPAPRFAIVFFTFAGLYSIFIILSSLDSKFNLTNYSILLKIIVCLTFIILSRKEISNIYSQPKINSSLFIPERPPKIQFRSQQIGTLSIKVLAPTDGNRCYDENIPCANRPVNTILLRNSSIKSGFKTTHSRTF